MSYIFTDYNNMTGKKVRQLYFAELQNATNDLADNKVGDTTTLTTTSKVVVGAINEVKNAKADISTTIAGYGITDAYTKIEVDTTTGILSSLVTTEKTNLVSAINETSNEITLLSGSGGTVEKANKSALEATNNTVAGLIATNQTQPLTLNHGQNAIVTDRDTFINNLKIYGKTLVNLLGRDGNCEDVSKWINYDSIHTLDTTNYVVGSTGIKITVSGTGGSGGVFNTKTNYDKTKYYCFSAYVKNGNATSINIYANCVGDVSIKNGNTITSTTTFQRSIVKTQPSEIDSTTNIDIAINVVGLVDQYAYVDGVMFHDITQAEFENPNYIPPDYADSYQVLQNPMIVINKESTDPSSQVFPCKLGDGETLEEINGEMVKSVKLITDEALTIASNVATLKYFATIDTVYIVDDSTGEFYLRVSTLGGTEKEFTQTGENYNTITFNAGVNPTTPLAYYSLATQTTEITQSEGSLALTEGANTLEVKEGIVVREQVVPIAHTDGRVYINSTFPLIYNPCKYRISKIIQVYKDNLPDNNWVVQPMVDSYGTERVYTIIALFDPTASYSVTYEVLDKYLYTTNALTATGTYDTNDHTVLGHTVEKVAEIETRVSVVERGKANKNQGNYIAPVLLNSWVNYGGTDAVAGYMLDDFGWVNIKGRIKSGTIGQTAWVMPVGLRPKETLRFTASSNDLFGEVKVSTDGTIVPTVGSNVSFNIQIRYRAEQ